MNSLDLKDALLPFRSGQGGECNQSGNHAGVILLLSRVGFQCNKGREVWTIDARACSTVAKISIAPEIRG
jgi:hypothetical protein